MYETNEKDVEVVDHSQVLSNAINAWRKEVEARSVSNSKKNLQSQKLKSDIKMPQVTS